MIVLQGQSDIDFQKKLMVEAEEGVIGSVMIICRRWIGLALWVWWIVMRGSWLHPEW